MRSIQWPLTPSKAGRPPDYQNYAALARAALAGDVLEWTDVSVA